VIRLAFAAVRPLQQSIDISYPPRRCRYGSKVCSYGTDGRRAVFCVRSVSNMIAGVQATVIVVKQREFRANVNRAVAVQQLLCPPRRRVGAFSDTAIRPSVPTLGVQLPSAVGTLAACRLALSGLRTCPRTDVDPPRVELPSAGAYRRYRLARAGATTCFIR